MTQTFFSSWFAGSTDRQKVTAAAAGMMSVCVVSCGSKEHLVDSRREELPSVARRKGESMFHESRGQSGHTGSKRHTHKQWQQSGATHICLCRVTDSCGERDSAREADRQHRRECLCFRLYLSLSLAPSQESLFLSLSLASYVAKLRHRSLAVRGRRSAGADVCRRTRRATRNWSSKHAARDAALSRCFPSSLSLGSSLVELSLSLTRSSSKFDLAN